jgi:hypothetical protein
VSWLWPDYVNRELQLSRRDAVAVHRDAWKLWWANKWNLLLYLLLPATFLVLAPFAADVGGRIAAYIGFGGPVYKACRAVSPFVLTVAYFIAGGVILQRVRFAPCVYQSLRRHGYDVCVKCGYWLKGLGADSPCCPECGTQRDSMPRRMNR